MDRRPASVPTIERAGVAGPVVLFASILLSPSLASAQPIPVELTGVHRYATVNLVMSRAFAPSSQFGFFHQSTLTADHDDATRDGITMQDLRFFEPVSGFRLTGGAFWGGAGFNPTAGLQYTRAARTYFLLLSPRVNIESDPSFSIFTIARYKPDLTDDTQLYLAMQALNAFDTDSRIKSYQSVHAGLDVRGAQFGAAVNFDEFGPHPDLRLSVGVFVRREIL